MNAQIRRLLVSGLVLGAGAAMGAPTGSALLGDSAGDVPGALGHERYEGRMVVLVEPASMREFLAVSAIAEDVWDERPGPGKPLQVVVSGEGLDAIRALGLDAQVVDGDLRRTLIDFDATNNAARIGTPGFDYDAYYPLADVEQKLTDLVAMRPDLASQEVIGQSLEGRDMRMLRITGPGSTAGRPRILINSLQHAREWITPPTTIYFAEQLLTKYGSDPEVTDLVDNIEFLIIPIANPDGYEYAWNSERLWRKNRRNNGNGTFGVDLNRNWSYAFGGPGSSGFGGNETYRGPFALSEPETQVLAGVFNDNPGIVAHVDTHSFSQLVLYPFGTSTLEPADKRLFELWSRDIADYIDEVHGRPYTPQRAVDLYEASGIMTDYAYGERNALSWTFELRPRSGQNGGFAPAPDQVILAAQEIYPAYLDLARGVRAQLRANVPEAAAAPLAEGEARSFVVEVLPVTDTVQTSGVRAVLTDDGTETDINAEHLGGDLYRINLPAAVCGDTVDFRVEADTTGGGTTVLGGSQQTSFSASVGVYEGVLEDDFSDDSGGWTITTGASSGGWVRAVPTGGGLSPSSDADGNGFAYITGAGAIDIDNGETELMSPVFNPGSQARISYDYWLNGGFDRADQMVVEVYNGADWVEVRRYTTAAPVWRRDSISVGPDGDVESWVGMRIRFRARDVLGANTVEAGVDAFSVERVVENCSVVCAADVNADGMATPADFTLWLAYFNTPQLPGSERADVNGDGSLTPADFTAWLAAFQQGC